MHRRVIFSVRFIDIYIYGLIIGATTESATTAATTAGATTAATTAGATTAAGATNIYLLLAPLCF